jgi:hypothetical protein
VEVRSSLVRLVHVPAFQSTPNEFAGPPPQRLSVVCRPESTTPPLDLTVAFVVRFWSSWCTPVPCSRCAATRRVLRRRRPNAAARARASPRPPDPQPTVQIFSRAGQTDTRRSTRRTRPAGNSQPPDLDPADQIRPLVLAAQRKP